MANFVKQSKKIPFLRLITAVFIALLCTQMSAQTYKVIYNFTGYRDGNQPQGRLIMDSQGRLYGTTFYGGSSQGDGYGNVYRLTYYNGNWAQTPIYVFAGGADGAHPNDGVTIGPDGAIYGTTQAGGLDGCSQTGYTGCGTVFVLRPSATIAATLVSPYKKATLYQFTGGSDGAQPEFGVVFQDANTMYGTTQFAGNPGCFGSGCGVVYQLARINGVWTESTIHNFSNDAGGCCPGGGVAIDQSGNLYGNAPGLGPKEGGTAFQLTRAGSSWTENVLYAFDPNSGGYGPLGTPYLAVSGKIYGTNGGGGTSIYGNVFELSPGNPSWTENVLHNFTGAPDGDGAEFGLVGDANGNLYGITLLGGDNDWGMAFELSPLPGGGWNYRVLHSFSLTDGSVPTGPMMIAPNGKLYGTAATGGLYGSGVVYEITP
jgi:hypothetical protein